MGKALSKVYPQKWIQIGLLLGLCFFLYVLNLGQWDLWNPDEPRYAQVAREMVSGGDWILMHFNGEPYPDKPPLFFWLIALSSYLWKGFSSFAVRFPSALFGTLTVVVTCLIGRKLYSSQTGLLSGLILGTSLEFAYLSTRANIDTTLTFFVTTALFFFFCWYQAEGKGKARLSIYGFYLGMGLATLAKGPVGLILPLLISLVYLGSRRDWRGIKEMRLPTGLLLFLVVVLAWYLPALAKGGKEYLTATLLRHTIERYSEGWSHVRPIYYYFYKIPVDFLPWVVFLPGAIAYGISREGIEKRREFFFLLIWCLVIFVFFSLSRGKRGLYLLPLYPAASILLGKLWDDCIFGSSEFFQSPWMILPLYGLAGLALGAGVAIPWALLKRFPFYVPYGIPVAAILVVGGLIGLVLRRSGQRHRGAVFLLLVGVVSVAFFYTSRVVFPLINPYKSSRFLCEEITARIRPGERLGIYGVTPGAYIFYTGIVPVKTLEKAEEVFEFLRSPGRVFCVVDSKNLDSLRILADMPKVELLAERQVGGARVLLISNR